MMKLCMRKIKVVKISVLLIFNSSFVTNVLSGGSRLLNFPPIKNTEKSLSQSILILASVRLQALIRIQEEGWVQIFCSITLVSTRFHIFCFTSKWRGKMVLRFSPNSKSWDGTV